MAALRAKKPVVKTNRLKTVLYADKGAGKTHFCCSIPDVYYIDTEKLEDYKKFVKMIEDNNGVLVYLTELSEVINEVKALLSVKHTYKTLVIDSISFAAAWLCQLEADRIISKGKNEDLQYSPHLAKAKRLTYHLAMLLTRLDMNVIVCAHEKTKYVDDKPIKEADVAEKMGHALGSVWNLRNIGGKRKLFVEKSRYDEIKDKTIIDFEDGYEVVKTLMGEELFLRESKTEELITPEQVKHLHYLFSQNEVDENNIQKILLNHQSTTLEELSKEHATKLIDFYEKKLVKETEKPKLSSPSI